MHIEHARWPISMSLLPMHISVFFVSAWCLKLASPASSPVIKQRTPLPSTYVLGRTDRTARDQTLYGGWSKGEQSGGPWTWTPTTGQAVPVTETTRRGPGGGCTTLPSMTGADTWRRASQYCTLSTAEASSRANTLPFRRSCTTLVGSPSCTSMCCKTHLKRDGLSVSIRGILSYLLK